MRTRAANAWRALLASFRSRRARVREWIAKHDVVFWLAIITAAFALINAHDASERADNSEAAAAAADRRAAGAEASAETNRFNQCGDYRSALRSQTNPFVVLDLGSGKVSVEERSVYVGRLHALRTRLVDAEPDRCPEIERFAEKIDRKLRAIDRALAADWRERGGDPEGPLEVGAIIAAGGSDTSPGDVGQGERPRPPRPTPGPPGAPGPPGTPAPPAPQPGTLEDIVEGLDQLLDDVLKLQP